MGQTSYGAGFGGTKKSIDTNSYMKTTLFNGGGSKKSSDQLDNMRVLAGRTVSNNMKKQLQQNNVYLMSYA